MKRVLVLGATGMAGHMVYYYLAGIQKYEMYNIVYRTKLTNDSVVVDVTDSRAICRILEAIKPDIVINCIGVLIKGAQSNPANAILLNSYFPHLLCNICDSIRAKLIHISTDCVFSGRKGNYTETDFRDADDTYGRSKALGEVINDRHLTIRTSIIGPELKSNGEGLFQWFMQQNGSVQGYKTAIWGGVTTLELAKAIDTAIDRKVTGLIQLSNGVGISKYNLLHLFKQIWMKSTDIKPVDANGVDKSIAKSTTFDYNIPSYEQMLHEMYEWMRINSNLYSQYR